MIIAMTAAGRSQAEIVEAINGSVRTVRRWQRDPSIVKDVVAAAGSGRFCESRLGRRRLCAPPQRRVPRCGYRVAVAAHAGASGCAGRSKEAAKSGLRRPVGRWRVDPAWRRRCPQAPPPADLRGRPGWAAPRDRPWWPGPDRDSGTGKSHLLSGLGAAATTARTTSTPTGGPGAGPRVPREPGPDGVREPMRHPF